MTRLKITLISSVRPWIPWYRSWNLDGQASGSQVLVGLFFIATRAGSSRHRTNLTGLESTLFEDNLDDFIVDGSAKFTLERALGGSVIGSLGALAARCF